ncbi:MAG TPA: DEAD/DEAH box helicase family protein, partial [Saprospiraceae bacterium]|nr:DEAD/DEAH box helicase family protein [Saprospiraceae bacterium]
MVKKVLSPEQVISYDNYFAQYPEKILGKAYITTGRFSDQVTKYKGDLTDLDKISLARDYVVADMLSAHLSSAHNDVDIDTISGAASLAVQKAIRKSKKERSVRDQAKRGELDLITFDEVDQLYNAHLSEEEKQVFVWYQRAVLGRPMKGGWEKYYTSDHYSKKAVPWEWMDKGLVFWYRDGYLPAFVYLSGNIAERREQLAQERWRFNDDFRRRELVKRQEKALDDLWQRVLRKRRTLDAEDMEDRLIIKPISTLAKEYKIKKLRDDVSLSAKQRRNGKIDYLDQLQTGYKKELDFAISLQEAFVLWLGANSRNLDIRRGLNWRDIVELYLSARRRGKDEDPALFLKNKSAAQQEGIRLFSDFLAKAISEEDQREIERIWNERYNSDIPIDLNQVPIGFTMARHYNGMEMDIRPEKREAIAFAQMRGAGCLAYGVGLGKTWASIFIVAQFLENGWASRPFFVLPNQVYKQFMAECAGILPQYARSDLDNLSAKYAEKVTQEERLPEQSISFFTYEGFKRIGIDTDEEAGFFSELVDILDQQTDRKAGADKDLERLKNKVDSIIGTAKRGTQFTINDLGLDMMVVDEAHSAKKVFTTVKSEKETNLGKEKGIKRYDISSGEPSAMGLKTFMVSQYVQRINPTGNVLLLTATPFTNSPMEIFSMTALVGLNYLREIGLLNLKDFFDQFVNTSNELVFSAALEPVFKDVFTGFSNLIALQSIIRRFFLYKQSTKNLKRPNKIVLPLRRKIVDGMLIEMGGQESIETVLSFNPVQREWMEDILAYAQEKVTNITAVCEKAKPDSAESGNGARLLRAAGMARKIAFSPYLLKCDEDTQAPKSVADFIKSSAKLEFVVGCIKSVQEYHQKQGTPMSGQIIYANMGVDYFPLLRDYLIKELGLKPYEVGIIVSESRMQKIGFKDKRTVQNAFLGRRYNPKTRDYEDIPHEYRCKVLIGSSTIREGINLQRYASVLYTLELPWNPTDVNQLEGRLWRQGNIHKNVRIVNPLMEDSMDIFMFQKLEEKTARINAIWDFDGNENTLDTRDFDPAELKYVLIKDPLRIAQLEAQEQDLLIDDQLTTLNAQISKLEEVKSTLYFVESRREEIIKAVEVFRDIPDQAKEDPNELRRQVAYMLRATKLKDGTPLEEAKHKTKDYYRNPYKDSWINAYQGISTPYWYKDWKANVAALNQAIKEILEPKGLPADEAGITKAVEALETEKEKIEEQKKSLTSEERLKERAKEIADKKAREGIAAATVEQRVDQFAKLNYMLD